MYRVRLILLTALIFRTFLFFSQNETAKWYFGYNAALDFMTNPPTILASSSMTVDEGCASISDNSGNLLFYTDGAVIWTKTHTVMANGTGLIGGHTPTQSSLILKKPGSATLYYVFTIHGNTWAPGLHYSIVDMSLASGNGSVTVKNANLSAGSVHEKVTATRHCNGTDFWIVVRDFSYINMNDNGNFHAFLLTSTGVSTTAVTSVFNYPTYFHMIGGMKISPNGKKIACANYNYSLTATTFEIFDFNPSTGVVSNSLALMNNFVNNVNSFFASGYGIEFSPDGTKLYGAQANFYATLNNGNIYEWDLCAGTNSAIAASQTTVSAATGTNYFGVGSMQLAKNGKIYVAHSSLSSTLEALSVINNPNGYGAGSNFVYGAQIVNSQLPHWGLPNYGSYNFLQHPAPPPFTYTPTTATGCLGAYFTAPALQNTVASCPASSYSITGYAWDFGDPLSGTNNISFLPNPSHNFSGPGTFTSQLILYYSCSGGSDTLRQVVSVSGTSLVVNTASITCASLGMGTVSISSGSGSYSYSWAPTSQSTSVVNGLIPGTYTISVSDNSLNCSVTNTVYFAPLIPLTANVVHTPSVNCYGANTASAAFTNVAGGSATQTYFWYNGTTSLTSSNVNGIVAGTWSATITDALTACQVNSVFTIIQPPALTLNIVPSLSAACIGASIALSGSCSGGTSGYFYLWSNASFSYSTNVVHNLPGTYVYTLNASDALGCTTAQTVALDYVAMPTIAVNSGSICPGNTFTIQPSGASNYTYSGGSALVSPTISSSYSVTGTHSLGCIATNTAVCFVTVHPDPTVTVGSGTICVGESFTIATSGAATYTCSAGSFVVQPLTTTAYTVSGTSAQGCLGATAATGTVVVNALPLVGASSNRTLMCAGESATLTATGALVYVWSNSANNASVIVNPAATTLFTVTGTDANGCTASFVLLQGVSDCAGIDKVQTTTPAFLIFPNPGTGKFQIRGSENAEISRVEVYDVTGRVVLKKSGSRSNTLFIDLTQTGVYTALIFTSGSLAASHLRFIVNDN